LLTDFSDGSFGTCYFFEDGRTEGYFSDRKTSGKSTFDYLMFGTIFFEWMDFSSNFEAISSDFSDLLSIGCAGLMEWALAEGYFSVASFFSDGFTDLV
jgi:hypothetical protein